MEEPKNGVRIVSILGTSRPGNFTAKALSLVNDELLEAGVDVTTIDPARVELSFPGHPATDGAKEVQDAVESATGVIIATPEYHGSFASALKLIIENLGFPSKLSGKPIALLGVASGRIGAIKSLEQLRSVCSHVGGIVLPGPVSVAGVNRVFDDEGHCLDETVEKQVRGVATHLLDYLDMNICPRIALEAIVRAGEDIDIPVSTTRRAR
jgi:NAD(P)H-dependent FMN reductase